MALRDHHTSIANWLGAGDSAAICEVGCGTGAVLRSLVCKTSRSGLGVDSDSRLIRAARFIARSCPQIEFRCGDAHRLPVLDDACDATFAFGVLQLVSDVDVAIGEMFRVTRPRGHVMVAHPVEEIEVPVDPALAEIDAQIALREQELWSRFRDALVEPVPAVTSASTDAILTALRARSATPVRVRGLFLPCSEQDLDRLSFERFVTRMGRQRTLWATRLAREAQIPEPELMELVSAYTRRVRAQLATHDRTVAGTLWTSPPLLVLIGTVP
ncbi:MAG: methyltransferase domain-containing protein [Phycisphaeraceae bacterium]|nr:methyltransferase domain-containing protein [Phycisphaeraceae bacterium]